MKEMIYSEKRKIEVLDTGYFFGLLYYIISLGTHPCAYVKIPTAHWLHGISDYGEMPINCHGGLTYCKDYLWLSENEKVEGKFIGWGYAHAGDYAPWYGDAEFFSSEHKWTTEEIQKEVKDVCYQIKELENESPADKMFEELGYKKVRDSKSEVVYKLGDKVFIAFYKISKMVQTYDEKNKSLGLLMQELQAINEKCKELRVVR